MVYNMEHLHANSKFVVVFFLMGVREVLVWKFEIKFPAHGVMDALGIVYP
jgi:hypothetical protein